MTELEERYGFAAQVAAMTYEALLSRRESERKNHGAGAARMYFLACLKAEISSRGLDRVTNCDPEQQ